MLSHVKRSPSLYVQRVLFAILGEVGDQDSCRELEDIYFSRRESADPRTMSRLVEAMAKLGGRRYLETFRNHLVSAEGNEDLQLLSGQSLGRDERSLRDRSLSEDAQVYCPFI
jgi:hypothetical protein